jgi:hypothetical protein
MPDEGAELRSSGHTLCVVGGVRSEEKEVRRPHHGLKPKERTELRSS